MRADQRGNGLSRLTTFLRRTRRLKRPKKSEGGFTLVELLITITILPLVVGAISVALISVFQLQSSVGNRLSNTGDAQLISATFLNDVQSSQQLTTETTSSPQCGSGTQLLGLEWDGGQNIVSYNVVTTTSGTTNSYTLIRQYCTLGNTTTPSATSTVSNGIAATQPAPTITCSSVAPSCATSTMWIPTTGILQVTFSITEPASNYTFALTAAPRAYLSSAGSSSSGLPYAPLTLLDPSSCNALSIGNGTISVNVGGSSGNGSLNVASTCAGAVTVANGGTLGASSVITADQSLNSIAPNSKATYPSTEYYGTNFNNPFANLTAPTTPTGPDVTCSSTTDSSGNVTYTCPPGVYTTSPTFSGTASVTVNFTPGGTFSFPAGLTFPNNDTVNYASGTYIFNGTTPLSSGNNVTMNGSNVLFYVGSGNVTFGNNDAITLSSMSGYDGVVIWDAVNPGTITIGDNTNLAYNMALNGGIYIPQGSIITGSNVTLSTSFVVADTATFGNNLSMTISAP